MSTKADEPTDQDIRDKQLLDLEKIHGDIVTERILAERSIQSTKEARDLLLEDKTQRPDKALPSFERKERVAYEKAMNETLSFTNELGLLIGEMEVSLKPEWKQVKKLSLEQRECFLHQKVTEEEELLEKWKANVNRVFGDAGIQESKSAVDQEDMWAFFRNRLGKRST